jgi:hypothetical protein
MTEDIPEMVSRCLAAETAFRMFASLGLTEEEVELRPRPLPPPRAVGLPRPLVPLVLPLLLIPELLLSENPLLISKKLERIEWKQKGQRTGGPKK